MKSGYLYLKAIPHSHINLFWKLNRFYLYKWNEALSNINAIYLICDSKNGKQYIGSTYGKQGLLGRWTEYYKTKDGGDVMIKKHLKSYPDAFLDFQFTILRVLQKSISINEATDIETLYKNKLLTRSSFYGLNMN